jgi:hypothetical protein
MIIGRLVFAEQSFYRGSSEALGYVDLKCFEKLCTSRGKVRLRNPFGTKFVTAQVKILYSR